MSTECPIYKVFDVPENDGTDKVVSLDEAISRAVRPGMTLYLGDGANALARELIRQFAHTTPNFHLVTAGLQDYSVDLIHFALVKKVTFSFCTEAYPTRGPCRVFQRAYQDKTLDVENWSLLSLASRLKAGAMGLPFMPTRSILGSTMAEDNQQSFQTIKDPFGSGCEVGLVAALSPALSLIHGLAADRYGNVIMHQNFASGEEAWGALAAREGVVATVEKLVSTDFIRKHSHMVRIPGYRVRSVSVVPFGCHPSGLYNYGIESIEPYDADNEFMKEHREARAKPEMLNAWLDNWIIKCPTEEDYFNQLGSARIELLKSRAQQMVRSPHISARSLSMGEPSIGTRETMVLAAASTIKQRVSSQNLRVILAGVGTSALAAWVAYYLLREANYDVELIAGTGQIGYMPRPGQPYRTSGYSTVITTKLLSDVIHTYGVFVGEKNSKCLSVLGAVQVDKFGNLNSTQLPNGKFLIGSGGANDAVNARDVLVLVNQSKGRFVEKVPYVTCPGQTVKTVVSDKGIFEKNEEGEIILTGYFGPGSKADLIAQIKESCSWDLRISSDLAVFPPPDPHALKILRCLDPTGAFTSE